MDEIAEAEALARKFLAEAGPEVTVEEYLANNGKPFAKLASALLEICAESGVR